MSGEGRIDGVRRLRKAATKGREAGRGPVWGWWGGTQAGVEVANASNGDVCECKFPHGESLSVYC